MKFGTFKKAIRQVQMPKPSNYGLDYITCTYMLHICMYHRINCVSIFITPLVICKSLILRMDKHRTLSTGSSVMCLECLCDFHWCRWFVIIFFNIYIITHVQKVYMKDKIEYRLNFHIFLTILELKYYEIKSIIFMYKL